MSLIVAKFGGTSVASPERIKNVAKRLVRMRQQGVEVVAVVSAMGKTTDELMGLASAVTAAPPARELDRLLSTGEQVSMTLLAMAIESMGYKSMSFTGRQAGIETDGTHNKAKIIKVHNERILDALEAGYIPVVAGFQGIDANGDITTLGRGGSDTTAVAIAWGINADVCEIYSDASTPPIPAWPRGPASSIPSATTTCWSSPAPARGCSRAAQWSSRASGRWSSIPARRSPRRKAPISRRSTKWKKPSSPASRAIHPR